MALLCHLTIYANVGVQAFYVICRMKWISIASLLLLITTAKAQSWQWADTLQFTDDRTVSAMLHDEEGNVYCASVASEPGSLALLSTFYCGDIHLRKYTSAGAMIWENILPGKARIFDMDIDMDGNIIAGGGYTQDLFVDGTHYETPIFVAGQFLIKMDTDGNIIWHTAEEPSVYSSLISCVTTDADNNIYAGGLDEDISSLLQKYNSDGELLLAADLLQVRTVSGVEVDDTGIVYVCGSAPDYAMLDDIAIPDEATGTGYVNFFAIYDSTLVAQKVYGQPYFTFDFNAYIAKNSGGIFWRCTTAPVGTFDYYNTVLYYHFASEDLDTIRSTITGFDFPLITMHSADDTSAWLLNNFSFETGLIRLNTSGEVVDSISIASPALELESFTCDAANLWVGGYATAATILDTFTLAPEGGDNYQPFIAKYGVTTPDTITCYAEFSYETINNQVFFTETSGDDIINYLWDFGDDNTSSVEAPTHTYEEDGIYIACLTILTADSRSATSCDTITISTSMSVQNLQSEIEVKPNPFREQFDLSVTDEYMPVSITNITGEQIVFEISRSEHIYHITFDAPQGMYILQISNGKEAIFKKLIRE